MADAFEGCIVNRAADSASTNFNGTFSLPWDNEIVDTNGYHSNVTTNTRITVPSAVNGRYGIFTVCLYLTSVLSDSYIISSMAKNSTNFCYDIYNMNTTLTGNMIVCTPPLLLTTSDFYECGLFCSDTATVLKANSTFSLTVMGA